MSDSMRPRPGGTQVPMITRGSDRGAGACTFAIPNVDWAGSKPDSNAAARRGAVRENLGHTPGRSPGLRGSAG